eukprot:COSAG02_NODE_568_length_20207_cov_50.273374_7_plen_47_part_00
MAAAAAACVRDGKVTCGISTGQVVGVYGEPTELRSDHAVVSKIYCP